MAGKSPLTLASIMNHYRSFGRPLKQPPCSLLTLMSWAAAGPARNLIQTSPWKVCAG